MRAISTGFLRRSMTADASNPECMAQFWQSLSWRDSQYSQSVSFQNSSHDQVYFLPIR